MLMVRRAPPPCALPERGAKEHLPRLPGRARKQPQPVALAYASLRATKRRLFPMPRRIGRPAVHAYSAAYSAGTVSRVYRVRSASALCPVAKLNTAPGRTVISMAPTLWMKRMAA